MFSRSEKSLGENALLHSRGCYRKPKCDVPWVRKDCSASSCLMTSLNAPFFTFFQGTLAVGEEGLVLLRLAPTRRRWRANAISHYSLRLFWVTTGLSPSLRKHSSPWKTCLAALRSLWCALRRASKICRFQRLLKPVLRIHESSRFNPYLSSSWRGLK